MDRRRRITVVLMLVLPVVLWMPLALGGYIALGRVAEGRWWAAPLAILALMLCPLVVAIAAPDHEVQFGGGAGAVLASVHFIAAVVVPFAYDGTKPTGYVSSVVVTCLVVAAAGILAGMTVSLARLRRQRRLDLTGGARSPQAKQGL